MGQMLHSEKRNLLKGEVEIRLSSSEINCSKPRFYFAKIYNSDHQSEIVKLLKKQ